MEGSEYKPPKAHDVEVSLFGPGFGEAIVIHLPVDQWLIIDSCISANRSAVAPLEYLQQIGVDVSKNVKAVVATHWHDDHVGGISEILRSCTSADFFCSSALHCDEFMALANAFSGRSTIERPGTKEIHKAFCTLVEEVNAKKRDRLNWAHNGTLLVNDVQLLGDKSVETKIYCLVPSSTSVTNSKAQFASLLPKPGAFRKALPSVQSNEPSIALHISVGDVCVVLGGDVESYKDPMIGWASVLTDRRRPQVKADLYKGSHHGSITGFHSEAYSALLSSPITILTPFVLGRHILPKRDDIKRMIRMSTQAFITSRPGNQRRARRGRVVEAWINEVAKSRIPMRFGDGLIRCRKSVVTDGAPWTVELFGSAVRL